MAVSVFASATVLVAEAVKNPRASVRPLAAINVFPRPESVNVTGKPTIALNRASTAMTVNCKAVWPSASPAAVDSNLEFAGSAAETMFSWVERGTVPSRVAEMVAAPGLSEANCAANRPVESVTPLAGETVPTLEVSDTGAPATAAPAASRATISSATGAPSATATEAAVIDEFAATATGRARMGESKARSPASTTPPLLALTVRSPTESEVASATNSPFKSVVPAAGTNRVAVSLAESATGKPAQGNPWSSSMRTCTRRGVVPSAGTGGATRIFERAALGAPATNRAVARSVLEPAVAWNAKVPGRAARSPKWKTPSAPVAPSEGVTVSEELSAST